MKIAKQYFKIFLDRFFVSKKIGTNFISYLLKSEVGFSKFIERIKKDNKLSNKFIEEFINDDLFVKLSEDISLIGLNNKKLKSLKKIINYSNGNISYSQSGEDLIIDYIFKELKIDKPTYIDIGAYDPYKFSNTAFFYLKGGRGVIVEPNPSNFFKFTENRPEDISLNVGISDVAGEIDYYVFDAPTLNTCSKKEADEFQREGNHKVIDVIKVKCDTLQNIIKNSCNGVFPDLLSLDAEGADEIVLRSIDYKKNCPKVICLETISFSDKISFSEKDGDIKDEDAINFLLSKGYALFADTYINTILVRKNCFVD